MARRGEVPGAVQAGRAGLADGRPHPGAGQAGAAVRRGAPADRLHALGLVHADLADVWVQLQYQVTSIDDYLSGRPPVEPGPQPRRLPPDGPADRHRAGDRGGLRARQRRPAAADVGRPRGLRRPDPGGVQRRPRLLHGPRARHRRAHRLRSGRHGADHRGDQEGRLRQRRGPRRPATAPSPAIEHKPSRPSTGDGRDRDLRLRHRRLLDTLRDAAGRARRATRSGRRQRARRLRRAPAAAAGRDRRRARRTA